MGWRMWCGWHSLLYIRCVFGWGWGGRLPTERCAESNGCAFLSSFYSQTELDMESYRCYVSKLITTFSLSQMNNVELARTSAWRENALFEEREKNVFVKPNEQYRACPNIVMARKRTFRGTRKEQFSKPIMFDYKQGIWYEPGGPELEEVTSFKIDKNFSVKVKTTSLGSPQKVRNYIIRDDGKIIKK